MKKACFVISVVLHLLFTYCFTTLKFTHNSPISEREKKEIIVVTPVRLYLPTEEDMPGKKRLPPVETPPEIVTATPGEPGKRPGPGDSEKPQPAGLIEEEPRQKRKIVNIIGSNPGPDLNPGINFAPGAKAPPAEPRFSLNPDTMRNIIGKTDRIRKGRRRPPGITAAGTSFINGRSFPRIRGCNIMPWAKRVINRIKTNWAIPPAGRISTKGLVGISIIVTRDGKISSAKLSKSSQDESLDKAALAAFTRSNPLPGLPEDFPYHDLRAYFLFNYDDPEITPMADERRER